MATDVQRDWISLEEIARLQGVPYKTAQRRLVRARAVYMNDSADARRRLYAITVLSPQERDLWLSEQASIPPTQQSVPTLPSPEKATASESLAAGSDDQGNKSALATVADAGFRIPNSGATSGGIQNSGSTATAAIAPVADRSLQPVLPFDLSPSLGAREQAAAAVPLKFKPYVEKWMGVVADCVNGTFKKYVGDSLVGIQVNNNDDYRKALARMHGVSYTAVYQKLSLFRKIKDNPAIPAKRRWSTFAEQLIPKPRPGRSGHSFYDRPDNDWMLGKLRDFYLNQAKLSMKAAHDLLILEIEAKQKAWGIGHVYDRPTLHQSMLALSRLSKPEKVLGREGEKAFDDKCAMYLSRDPWKFGAMLHANDLWVTDQREVDVIKRDGGEHLGRIWKVTFKDVASDKVLGYSFGPIFSSDTVMMAATMAIERYGVPKAVHMDLGKEFIGKAFNGSARKMSGEALYREASGLWESLGVRVVKAIGRNPKTKTIERWHEEVTKDFDKCFPGYCGSNTSERPEKLADETRQHMDWLAGKVDRTPLVTISQYIHAFIKWVEVDWNDGARGRGKMRRGMTPNEAFRVKTPTSGFRMISSSELDLHSAEHRFVKVARGGQVNLTFFGQAVEYEAPELFLHQGQDVEVIISRRTFRQVTVIYPIAGGTASCVATLKPQLDWLPENRDELRAAMRCKAAVSRAIRHGVKASRVALEAANPVELLESQKALPAKEIIGAQKFFAPSPEPRAPKPDFPETGSMEYLSARKTRTASSAAERFMEEEQ